MDRVIENKRWIKKKYIPYLVGGALALILVIWLIFGNHLSTLKVDKRLLTIEPAQQGQFNDYVRVNGHDHSTQSARERHGGRKARRRGSYGT